MGEQSSVEWHAKMLRAWHLAILRFAVTLDNADRLGVLAIANEIDRLGRQCGEAPDFCFFRRTSAALCGAILQPSEAAKTSLRTYLARLDDPRLTRALAAALQIDKTQTAPMKRRSRQENTLWRGLLSRSNLQR